MVPKPHQALCQSLRFQNIMNFRNHQSNNFYIDEPDVAMHSKESLLSYP